MSSQQQIGRRFLVSPINNMRASRGHMRPSRGLFQERCKYCKRAFQTSAHVSRHVAHLDSCRRQWEKEVQNLPACQVPQKDLKEKRDNSHEYGLEEDKVDIDQNEYVLPEPYISEPEIEVQMEGPVKMVEVAEDADDLVDNAYLHTRWTEEYPGQVAEASGTAKTTFDELRE